jgi:hypothetical protein
MKILLNSTKTMDLSAPRPSRLKPTVPAFQDRAEALMAPLQRLSQARLATEMALSARLAADTRAILARWGQADQVRAPALFAFTGLVYKYIKPGEWTTAQVRDAQQRLLILSGLYGLLRPLDLVAAYRLEMGSRLKPPRAANLVAFWRETLTAAINEQVKPGEPILNLAAQEYVRALDVKALNGPLISPIFKEIRPDGSLKTAPVHAKMARGAVVKFVFTSGAQKPADLLGFGELGWEANTEAPAAGDWLFTRPARG